MPIPSSGAVSLNAIQTEFGGSPPTSINEYYAGGANVPAGTVGNPGPIPSSGQISFSQFYGSAKATRGCSTYTTSGTYTWTAPNSGVTSVSIVAIGGGAAGSTFFENNSVLSRAPGGGLGYVNNIPVTGGTGYTVVVGAGGQAIGNQQGPGGQDSYVTIGSQYIARGGKNQGGNVRATNFNMTGGSSGLGGYCGAAGGGGAAGYSGQGGCGATSTGQAGTAASAGSGAGGGGGAGAFYDIAANEFCNVAVITNGIGGGAGGGGTSVYGSGPSGSGGAAGFGGAGTAGGVGGQGGSSGTAGSSGQSGTCFSEQAGGAGGGYGGGGGKGGIRESIAFFINNCTCFTCLTISPAGSGAAGAVRIVYPGSTRSFPSTDVSGS